MPRIRNLCAWLALPALLASSEAEGRDWPSWRGPEQCGLSRETDLPSSWSPPDAGGENLLWHHAAGGRSAPVVLHDRVYLQGLAGEGERQQERVICFDAATGRVLWDHRFNVFLTDIPNTRVGWANPAADPETGYVYAHGVQGYLKCLDAEGKVVWERSLTEEFGRISGYGGRTHTPFIDEDRLIISFLNSSWGGHSKGSHRYLALDKRTGAVLWWADPGGQPLDTTYSCPVVTVVNGRRLLVAGNADGSIYAMEARTGRKVWGFRLSKRGINSSVVARDGLVWASHSEENIDTATMGRLVCIDATGTGDVTETHEKWRVDEVEAGYGSPALVGDDLYVVDNHANLHCFDPMSGEKRWTHDVGTAMKASPVVADGKLYIGASDGLFSVVDVGADGPETLDRQEFRLPDGRPIAIDGSACVANGRVYFPTHEHLYCIAEEEWNGESKPVPPRPEEAAVAADAEPATLQVVPGDVTLYPGQSTFFKARLFDDGGRFLHVAEGPAWSVDGLDAQVDDEGRLSVAEGTGYAAGLVEARSGSLTATARVRVVPQLPVEVDFEDVPEGGAPAGWIGATPVKFRVTTREGSKVLFKPADRPRFMLANCYFGLPGWTEYTIRTDILGTETRRQLPNAGVIANRYELALLGNEQRLRVTSWVPMPRVEKKVPFPWKPDTWYRMKLRVDQEADGALVRGKVWPRGEDEPQEWSVVLRDPVPNRSGCPGLQGYSAGSSERSPGAEIYWDNVVIRPND